MSWTRGVLAALAVCVLLLTGSAGCGASDAGEPEAGESATPVGRLLDATDEEGRRYREVDAERAPEVGIEVQPAADDSWDVRLTVRDFRFSPAGTETVAVPGRGLAHLFLDGELIARLHGPDHRLEADLVPAARTSSPSACTPTTAPSGPSTASRSRARRTSRPRTRSRPGRRDRRRYPRTR